VPVTLDKKGGRRFHLSSIFCVIKDGTLFSLFCIKNQALLSLYDSHRQQTHTDTQEPNTQQSVLIVATLEPDSEIPIFASFLVCSVPLLFFFLYYIFALSTFNLVFFQHRIPRLHCFMHCLKGKVS
jgi:hypothetical protein